MVSLLSAGSIWVQLGNLCFLLSGLFGDLLVIRLCLFSAYTWLLTAACVGYPAWPSVSNPGFIGLDGMIWAVLNLFFHGIAAGQLLWDERRIHFSSEDDEQVWRFFLRRSGMGRLEMKESLKRARKASYQAGQTILVPAAAHTTLMLLVEGQAAFTFKDPQGKLLKEGCLLSGMTFDVGLLNVLGVYIAFEKSEREHATVVASTPCTAYLWDIADLDHLACRCAPATSAFWRSFALCQVGLEWHARANPHLPQVHARGRPEPEGYLQGGRSADFTDPLEEWEAPRSTAFSVLAWLPSKFAPFLPPGMRHQAMPSAGALARNRLMALAAAHHSSAQIIKSTSLSARSNVREIVRSLKLEGVVDERGNGNGKVEV